jgi:hypothetical protein
MAIARYYHQCKPSMGYARTHLPTCGECGWKVEYKYKFKRQGSVFGSLLATLRRVFSYLTT